MKPVGLADQCALAHGVFFDPTTAQTTRLGRGRCRYGDSASIPRYVIQRDLDAPGRLKRLTNRGDQRFVPSVISTGRNGSLDAHAWNAGSPRNCWRPVGRKRWLTPRPASLSDQARGQLVAWPVSAKARKFAGSFGIGAERDAAALPDQPVPKMPLLTATWMGASESVYALSPGLANNRILAGPSEK